MDGEKRYDEKAVAEILRRAAELERTGRGGAAAGLTRGDLEAIAAESGLDPATVRRAIEERERAAEAAPVRGVLGGPTRLQSERHLEGELGAEAVGDLLGLAQHQLGMPGPWHRSGRSWTWKPTGVTRELQLGVQVRDGRTSIRLDEELRGLLGGLWGGLFGGSLGAAFALAMPLGFGAFHSGAAALAIFGAVMAGSFLLTRGLFGAAVRRRREALRRLADRLAEEGREMLASPARAAVASAGDEESGAGPAFGREGPASQDRAGVRRDRSRDRS